MELYIVMVSAPGGKAGGRLILHYKKVATIKMAMHFLHFVPIYNVGLLNPVKLRGKFFGQCR